MTQRKVHLYGADGLPVCGVHRRWGSCQVSGTKNPERVTCARCRRHTRPLAAKIVDLFEALKGALSRGG